MTLVLDPATEARIQAELATGRYAAPDELLNRALDSLNASLQAESAMNEPTPQEMEDWLLRNKDAINAALDETFAQAERGEGYSPEESRALLARHRAQRAA
jgi:Arc/MetJ-type ribon-helix-helix transcriptional regulator